MGTDDYFAPAGPTFGSVAGPASDFIISSALGSVTGPAPDSVTGPTSGIIAGSTPGVVVSRIAFIVIDLTKGNYFYEKQVIAEDLTNSKLYMKETIWIEGIPFGEIGKAWNYMLDIPDDTQRAKVAKDLGHQFILLAEKMRDGYQQFSDLVKHTWKETGIAKNIMTDIIIRLRPHITINKEKNVFSSKTLVAINKY